MNRHLGNIYKTINRHLATKITINRYLGTKITINRHLGDQNNNKSTFTSAI